MRMYYLLLIAALFTPLCKATEAASEVDIAQTECVVLLHGLWRTELSMKRLEWGLTEAGFGVANVTYPSLSYPIEELATMAVEEGVAECRALGLDHIHFVTHSLGGILVRKYLADQNIKGLGRVVMLGPPNQGSQVADYIDSLGILRPFTPVAVAQLGTGAESLPRQLGPVNFELGVIAGTDSDLSVMPGAPQETSDGTVTVAETIVPGMLDLLEMPVSHTFMMWNQPVLHQVIHFLNYGVFDRDVLQGSAP